jgi:hypothetical protein
MFCSKWLGKRFPVEKAVDIDRNAKPQCSGKAKNKNLLYVFFS